jgi:hypothetical protein
MARIPRFSMAPAFGAGEDLDFIHAAGVRRWSAQRPEFSDSSSGLAVEARQVNEAYRSSFDCRYRR